MNLGCGCVCGAGHTSIQPIEISILRKLLVKALKDLASGHMISKGPDFKFRTYSLPSLHFYTQSINKCLLYIEHQTQDRDHRIFLSQRKLLLAEREAQSIRGIEHFENRKDLIGLREKANA